MLIDFGDGFVLRKAGAGDDASLRKVCLETGDSGGDATGREDDPNLLGDIYAVPYRVHAPDFAFVVDSPDGVVGYVLGAPDTSSIYQRMRDEWFPRLAAQVIDPGPDESRWTGSDWARHALKHPDLIYPELLHDYPAHGHIDLLEPARGRGIGARGMRYMLERLAETGAGGMHLQVSPRNFGALKFYGRLGFSLLTHESLPRHTAFMVKRFQG